MGLTLATVEEWVTRNSGNDAKRRDRRKRSQKSNCALIFANRAVITDVGVSHRPFGMNAWL